MSECRRVVVTGMGIVSPVGSDMQTAWENLTAGYNGIGPITCFDTTNYKAKLGAEVKGFDPLQYMDRSETLRSDKFAQYAMGAAVQAVEESGVLWLRHWWPEHRFCGDRQAGKPGPPPGIPAMRAHDDRQHGGGHDRHSLQL